MTSVVENSIQIYGMGHPDTITVFNMKSEEDRKHFRFKNLTSIINRKLTIWFDTENDGVVKKENFLKMTIPNGTEEEIKDFILEEINKTL